MAGTFGGRDQGDIYQRRRRIISMAFESLMMILETCREKEIPFWEAILLDDMNERNADRQESMEQMRSLWRRKRQIVMMEICVRTVVL